MTLRPAGRGTVAALDSVAAVEFPHAPDVPSRRAAVLLTWRTPGRRRFSCIAWSVLALLAAIAVEVTGPRRPVTFSLRLPLIVLFCGALWCATRWRRRVVVTTDEVLIRTLVRTRRIRHSAAGAGSRCVTAVGTGLFIARARGGPVARARFPVPSAVPMMTPCLIMTAGLIVALATAKMLTVAPRMSGPLIAVSAAVCVTALAACFRLDRVDKAGGAPPGAMRARRGLGVRG